MLGNPTQTLKKLSVLPCPHSFVGSQLTACSGRHDAPFPSAAKRQNLTLTPLPAANASSPVLFSQSKFPCRLPAHAVEFAANCGPAFIPKNLRMNDLRIHPTLIKRGNTAPKVTNQWVLGPMFVP
jgi:hypothetical protein